MDWLIEKGLVNRERKNRKMNPKLKESDPYKSPHIRIWRYSDNESAGIGFPAEEYDRISSGMGYRVGTLELTDIFGCRLTLYWEDISQCALFTQEAIDAIERKKLAVKLFDSPET